MSDQIRNNFSAENSRNLIDFINTHKTTFDVAALINQELDLIRLTKESNYPNKQELIETIITLPGIDLGVKDNRGDTALHWAGYKGDLMTVNQLLSAITDVALLTQKNLKGRTPIEETNSNNCYPASPTIIEAIQEAIAGRKPANSVPKPSLRDAALFEIECFKSAYLNDPKEFDHYIQENKNRYNIAALINTTKVNGSPALIYFTRHTQAESYVRSLSCLPGIDYGVTDIKLDTALHWAAALGKVAVVDILLNAISDKTILEKKIPGAERQSKKHAPTNSPMLK